MELKRARNKYLNIKRSRYIVPIGNISQQLKHRIFHTKVHAFKISQLSSMGDEWEDLLGNCQKTVEYRSDYHAKK